MFELASLDDLAALLGEIRQDAPPSTDAHSRSADRSGFEMDPAESTGDLLRRIPWQNDRARSAPEPQRVESPAPVPGDTVDTLVAPPSLYSPEMEAKDLFAAVNWSNHTPESQDLESHVSEEDTPDTTVDGVFEGFSW